MSTFATWCAADMVPSDDPTFVGRPGSVAARGANFALQNCDFLLIVADRGPGLAPGDEERVFERFYRGGAARQSGAPGTGLGLAIVKQVVDHHRGRIEVQNGTNEQGTKFTVWLPVKQPQETD